MIECSFHEAVQTGGNRGRSCFIAFLVEIHLRQDLEEPDRLYPDA